MYRLSSHFVIVTMLFLLSYSARAQNHVIQGAQAYIVQGSTTFAHRVMEPYQTAIEASSGHKLIVVPNKSSLGLLALFEKRGDFAMISGPLEYEIGPLKSTHPDLRFDRLQLFNVATTRMAFAINQDNPVHEISDENLRRILLGEITNWRDVGGSYLPIRVVMVRIGGGVQASIENEFLKGKKISVPNPILVNISSQVVKITEQLPEALGLSQLSIVLNSNARELKTDHPIEQTLNLVTLGDPTSDTHKVMEVTRSIMSTAPR
jgi:phosphate transport system substrate-binding protein